MRQQLFDVGLDAQFVAGIGSAIVIKPGVAFEDGDYEPAYQLNDKQDGYLNVANNTVKSQTREPMPVGISFWSGIGEEPAVIRIASIYEAATRHRQPPPAFGPVTK